jgi:hypothetical protein
MERSMELSSTGVVVVSDQSDAVEGLEAEDIAAIVAELANEQDAV